MQSVSGTAAQVVSITKSGNRSDSSDQARVAREAGHWPRVFTKEAIVLAFDS